MVESTCPMGRVDRTLTRIVNDNNECRISYLRRFEWAMMILGDKKAKRLYQTGVRCT